MRKLRSWFVVFLISAGSRLTSFTVGHRARDCPEPRKDRFACRNCKRKRYSSRRGYLRHC